MKVFQDLFIRGEPEAFLRTLEEIEKLLNKGWSRDFGKEWSLDESSDGKWYIFYCPKSDDRPEATLYFTENKPREWHVANIVPKKQSELTFDQYNRILQEFTDIYLRPAALITGVEIILTNPEISIGDFLNHDAVDALSRFSKLANRSMLHPLDEKRWYEFIVIAYKSNARLDSFTLQRWLIEEEKWPEDKASKLSIEYEKAIALLKFYDGLR